MTVARISVGFISLGCAKNLVDSQIMADRLLEDGIELAPSPEDADLVVVNTCAFIEDAREESVEMILSACRLKEEGRCTAVLVAGCLPQRYREDLRASLPEVDGFIGLDELDEIGGIARRLCRGEHDVVAVSRKARRLYEPGAAGVVFSGGSYAYLKIAEGCNHRCAFCAIPAIRGTYRSRPVSSIVTEAERLLEKGFRELALISQDTTSYGRDLDDGADLPALLRALGSIGGDFWVRILYGYPSRVNEALLAAMAEVPQVVPYLDIPIQHSHPDVLRGMKRAATVPHVARMAERVRKTLPEAVLRTTCLVGFPGETAACFDHLLQHVKEVGYDHLGVFTFSPEEGTAAADMPGRPAPKTAQSRAKRLMAAQRRVVEKRMEALMGTETTLLLERPVPDEPGAWMGRVRRQAPEVDGDTFIDSVPDGSGAGDLLPVQFVGHADYDFEVETVD